MSKFKRKDVAYLMMLGLIGVAIPQSLIFIANELSGPDIVAMMNPSGPVYAALLACALKLEIMTWCKAIGIIMSVGGALGRDIYPFNNALTT